MSNETKREVTFGNGRYSPVMAEFYSDAKRLLGLSETQAERAARSLGNDLGRCHAENKISIGKVTGKDSKITVKEVATIKTNLTYSIGLCKACAMLQEVKKYGISGVEVEISEAYMSWLNEKPATPVIEQKKETAEATK